MWPRHRLGRASFRVYRQHFHRGISRRIGYGQLLATGHICSNSREYVAFITKMDAIARSVFLESPNTVTTILHEVAHRLSLQFGRRLSIWDCSRMLKQMRSRYYAFKDFLNHRGVVYNVRRNFVHVSQDYWASLHGRLFHNEAIYLRHMCLCGEPFFTQLRNVFSFAKCVVPTITRVHREYLDSNVTPSSGGNVSSSYMSTSYESACSNTL